MDLAANAWPSRAFLGPEEVWQVLLREAASGDLFYHLGATLGRVAAAYVVAMIAGSVIGILLGSYRGADRFFNPWVILFLNIPALVIIVLAYIWFGLNEVAAIGAVAVNKIPNVVVTMREGARARDPRYAEMAAVYRFGPLDRVRHILLPQLQPYLAAASRSGIALIWKIVLVVELLGRSNGVGFQIYLYFQLFDVAAILAYTLAFVAVMLVVELLLVQPVGAAVPLRVDIAEKTFRSAQGVSVTALKNLSFEVRQGEFACLLGPSGCGKTTTLRIVLGLDKQFSGSFQLPEVGSHRIAAVFQEPTLLPWRTVEQNVRLALPKDLRTKNLDGLFASLGLTGMRSLYPAELSLGLARRAALARAFATEPAVLFLDEPFVSLDGRTAEQLRRLLLAVWSARPTTALMVTHHLTEALTLSDRIIVLAPRPAHVSAFST